ncbi:DUF924 family protein, partial [uncultured Acetobacterium sp.]|uniref:DUF924 family protein n=1 Tax=uncultured Acetobacterium sp. TaxID=217139 RepID=UPI0025E9C699
MPKRKIVGKLPVLRRADIRQADHQVKMGRRIPATLSYEIIHKQIIDQFGRYPHRCKTALRWG